MKRASFRFFAVPAALAAAIATSLVTPEPARADVAGAFLKSLEGSWRGRGTARIAGRGDAERVTCRVQNNYQAANLVLSVDGNCATTQAKSAVRGRLVHNGSSVTGSLLNAIEGSTMTQSKGQVSGGKLTVSSSFVDDRTGGLTRSRQVIRLTSNGFRADFFLYDNAKAKYEPAGQVVFTQR